MPEWQIIKAPLFNVTEMKGEHENGSITISRWLMVTVLYCMCAVWNRMTNSSWTRKRNPRLFYSVKCLQLWQHQLKNRKGFHFLLHIFILINANIFNFHMWLKVSSAQHILSTNESYVSRKHLKKRRRKNESKMSGSMSCAKNVSLFHFPWIILLN